MHLCILCAFPSAIRKCKCRSCVCPLFFHPFSTYIIPHCLCTHTQHRGFFLFHKLNQSKQQNQASSLSTQKFVRLSGSPSCSVYTSSNYFNKGLSIELFLVVYQSHSIIWSSFFNTIHSKWKQDVIINEFPRSTNYENYWHKSLRICYEHNNIQLQNKARIRAEKAPNTTLKMLITWADYSSYCRLSVSQRKQPSSTKAVSSPVISCFLGLFFFFRNYSIHAYIQLAIRK